MKNISPNNYIITMPFLCQKSKEICPGDIFLIIKPGAIGDVLHITPVVRMIKMSHPSSRIIFLVGDRITYDLLFNNPYLDEVIIFQKGNGVGEIRRILNLGLSSQMRGVDWVLNYQTSNWRWWFLIHLLKPKGILKYQKQKRVKAGEKRRHAVEDHLALLEQLGIQEGSLNLNFFLTDKEISQAMDRIGYFQKGFKGIIGFNIGASHSINRWPVSFFHRLNVLLTSAGFKTILLGGTEDRKLADQFFTYGGVRILDLVGCTTIRETAAVINQCDLLVSGDTGPLHLATAVGTKVIGLFGAAHPERTGPIGEGNHVFQAELPCVPCERRHCKFGTVACMEAIQPEVVAEKINKMVQNETYSNK